MGDTQSRLSSKAKSPGDAPVHLPIPSWLGSPHCESLQSFTPFHDYISPSYVCNSATYTKSRFLFEVSNTTHQMSDCWNSYDSQQFKLNEAPEMSNAIHRISTSNRKNDWISVFGTQIIRNGETKTWNLKIYPRDDAIDYIINHKEFPIADLVIGVVDADSVRNSELDTSYNHKGGFWSKPYFGYGYYGFNGKKFHKKRRGKAYGERFKVGDVITIELDLIQCNELKFYVNDVENGVSFVVDGDRDYILAAALLNQNYDIQIRP